jgi:hypothetical protein
LIFGSSVVLGVPVSAGARVVDTVDDFFADLDIEILRSVQNGIVAAPPKPHLGDQAGGAGSLSASSARDWRQYRSICAGRPVLSDESSINDRNDLHCQRGAFLHIGDKALFPEVSKPDAPKHSPPADREGPR